MYVCGFPGKTQNTERRFQELALPSRCLYGSYLSTYLSYHTSLALPGNQQKRGPGVAVPEVWGWGAGVGIGVGAGAGVGIVRGARAAAPKKLPKVC